jgi:hypothetical protein
MPRTMIELTPADRDSLKKLKLAVAGDIGQNFSMGVFVGILAELGSKHRAETSNLARNRLTLKKES